MRFKKFLEDVVDGNDEFKKKRGQDFEKKIKAIADDMPNLFKKQADLEQQAKDTITKLQTECNKKFSKYRLKLAPVLKEYQKGMFIPLLFYFFDDAEWSDWSKDDKKAAGLADTEEHNDLVLDFVKEHGAEAKTALEEYKKGMDDLAAWSKTQKWPAGDIHRFTKFDYEMRELKDCIKGLDKLMKKVA